MAEQHVSNRQSALVCEHCFRYIGPLELQLGFRLLTCCPPEGIPDPHATALALLSGAQQLPQPSTHVAAGSASPRDRTRDPADAAASDDGATWRIPWQLQRLTAAVKPQRTQSATSDGASLQAPSSRRDHYSAPHRMSGCSASLGGAVRLGDGTPYLFCSHDCAALAWVSWAAILSPAVPASGHQHGCTHAHAAASSSQRFETHIENLSRALGAVPEAVWQSPFITKFDARQVSAQVMNACTMAGTLPLASPPRTDASVDRATATACDGAAGNAAHARSRLPQSISFTGASSAGRLAAFYEHANRTNDIFRVAARAVATVASAACMHCAQRTMRNGGAANAASRPSNGCASTPHLEPDAADVAWAWQPFRAVHKALWWQCVHTPLDVHDAVLWRQELRSARHTHAASQLVAARLHAHSMLECLRGHRLALCSVLM